MSAAPTNGPAEYGNLEANLRFIEDSGILRVGADILEIGSGTGSLLNRLLAQGHRIQGIDVNARLIDEGRAWFGPLPVQHVDGTELPFPDRSFDIVMSFDVLEHIPDTDAHLREVRRVLRPGGTYLLQTPNKWTNVIFETIRWRSFTKFRTDHCSLHSLGELRRRFAAHGFLVRPFPIPVVNRFFRQKVRRYLGWPGLAALAIANLDRLPLALRTNLYVVATLTGAPSSQPVRGPSGDEQGAVEIEAARRTQPLSSLRRGLTGVRLARALRTPPDLHRGLL